jgi:hypothetical protein
VKYSSHFGLSVLPLNSLKKPSVKWKALQSRKMTINEIVNCSLLENVGIVTGEISGIAVIDCDTQGRADQFWRELPTPVVVETPRGGVHYYYRHPGQHVKTCQADGFDIRGDGGYVAAPPTVVRGRQYRFRSGSEAIRPELLPLFNLNWIPKPKTETGSTEMDNRIRNVEAYIKEIHAISGQRGHDKTFKVVCKLKDSGMSELEAWAVLYRWNDTNADPSWSEKELLHKLKSVYGKA